ncbi:hypothetical protein ACJ70E_08770 [Pseudomonas plecoglossicida]|uniref:hypothetical protein n=1 Tax=Pseudomonas plecoglossicida TaxID=70775 RepID=UPI0039774BD5
MGNPRSLTITVEAKSDEHLRKLLDLAVFDLSKMHENLRAEAEGGSIPLTMAGDMGSYRLDYHLGSHAFIAAHRNLIEQGYSLVETTDWKTDDYSLYQHAENPPLRLYLNSALIGEHDAEEHQDGNIPF